MYNTGDLGRVRDDGSLDHLGRIDDQVKVKVCHSGFDWPTGKVLIVAFKGFRVELDGVSAAMRHCPGVSSACALLIGTELWGFYSPAVIPPTAVQQATSLSQPMYAIPSKFVPLDALPLTR